MHTLIAHLVKLTEVLSGRLDESVYGTREQLCHKCMHDRAIPVRHLVVNLNNKGKDYICVYLL